MKNRCLSLWAQAALDFLQLAEHSCLEKGTSFPASCPHLRDHSPPSERPIAGENLTFFFFKSTPPIIQLDSLDSPAVIMIQYPVWDPGWTDGIERIEQKQESGVGRCELGPPPILTFSPHYLRPIVSGLKRGTGRNPERGRWRGGETKSQRKESFFLPFLVDNRIIGQLAGSQLPSLDESSGVYSHSLSDGEFLLP